MSKYKKSKSKFYVKAKVSGNTFVTYHFNSLNKFIPFMRKEYPDFRWMNIYDKRTGVKVQQMVRRELFG